MAAATREFGGRGYEFRELPRKTHRGTATVQFSVLDSHPKETFDEPSDEH